MISDIGPAFRASDEADRWRQSALPATLGPGRLGGRGARALVCRGTRRAPSDRGGRHGRIETSHPDSAGDRAGARRLTGICLHAGCSRRTPEPAARSARGGPACGDRRSRVVVPRGRPERRQLSRRRQPDRNHHRHPTRHRRQPTQREHPNPTNDQPSTTKTTHHPNPEAPTREAISHSGTGGARE